MYVKDFQAKGLLKNIQFFNGQEIRKGDLHSITSFQDKGDRKLGYSIFLSNLIFFKMENFRFFMFFLWHPCCLCALT